MTALAPELDIPPHVAFRMMQAAMEARALSCPRDLYIPGRPEWEEQERFQLQFHQSTHVIRAMFLGNGSGKTTVAGIEADYWLQHAHPYQKTPTWNIQVIWVTLKFQQMDLLRTQLEESALSPGWRWNDNKHKYVWPNGSQLHVVSNDGDWAGIQGVRADLVIVDEECDVKLWRELTMRRRGMKKTRYVIAATATKGKRWMYRQIFLPWLKFHEAQDLTLADAMHMQKHPTRWVWPVGGIMDNPVMTDADLQWYEQELVHATPAERQVRLRGGFMDMNAAPVFDHEGVQDIEKWARLQAPGQIGVFAPKPLKDRKNPRDVFIFQAGEKYEGGEIRVFEQPVEGESYVIGADFGYGLANSDYDAIVVIRQKTKTQVASAVGRWGDVHMAWVLYAMGYFYNEALIVGEQQVGLPVLRRLYDEWGYTYLYHDKDEKHQAPRHSDELGHFSYHGDPIIPRLQWGIAPRDQKTGVRLPPVFNFRDPEVIEQLYKYEWRPKSKNLELQETRNKDLTRGAPPGFHDDLVMAAAFAVHGWIELPKFKKAAPTFPKGSLGELLGHKGVWNTTLNRDKPKVQGVFKHAKGAKEKPKR